MAGAGRVNGDFFDTDQKGFLLEVQSTGRRTFYLGHVNLYGRRPQFKLGPAGVLSVEQARRAGLPPANRARQSSLPPAPNRSQLCYAYEPETARRPCVGLFRPHIDGRSGAWFGESSIPAAPLCLCRSRRLADKYGSVLSKKDAAKAGSFADKRLVEAILSFARRFIRIKRKRRPAEAPRC